jgi:hypothetical protein
VTLASSGRFHLTLTDEEQREYEARKQRIHELFQQLDTFKAAA